MGSKAAEYMSRTTIGAYFHSARESRKLVLVIVAIALLLDNMLLTTVGIIDPLSQNKSDNIFPVPIIPEFLYHVRHRYDNLTTTTIRHQPTVGPSHEDIADLLAADVHHEHHQHARVLGGGQHDQPGLDYNYHQNNYSLTGRKVCVVCLVIQFV